METDTSRRCQRLFEPSSHDMTRPIWNPRRTLHDHRDGGRTGARQRPMARLLVSLSAVLGLAAASTVAERAALPVVGAPGVAHAGDVEGKIVFKPNKLGKPPVRNKGFLDRIENPLRPIRKFNPRPYMIVSLDGAAVDDEAKKAPAGKVRYYLQGQSFDRSILPVVVQSRVELVNSTGTEATLFTPDAEAIAEPHTLNPRGMHDFQVTESGTVIVIRSQDENHIEGRVVAFPNRYFATIDRRGKFEIKDVPEGTFKVRVWYRDGWLEGVEASVDVDKRRGADVDLTISPDKVRK